MLRPVRRNAPVAAPAAGAAFAIVASEYNRRHVDGLLDAAVRALQEAGATVDVHRVPGAFEIPVVVETLLKDRRRHWSAVLAFGVIIRGETGHADLVGTAVTQALMQSSVRHGVPVIHEVLLVANRDQADVRCLDPNHNRGAEAAATALAMSHLMPRLKGERGAGDESGRGSRRSRGRRNGGKKRAF